MKLSRNTLRSLAVGFLASAVVTAAFALSQGQLPVQGVNGINVLNGGTTSTNAEQQAQLDALSSEKAALESTQNVLNASLASIREEVARQSSELVALRSQTRSDESSTSLESSSESSVEAEAAEDTLAQEAATESPVAIATPGEGNTTGWTPDDGATTVGDFTIAQGESAEQVALNLYNQGFISSPDVFMEVVNIWDLSTVLQAGTFHLNSNMNVNEIAQILTQGVYYWIP